MTRLVQGELTPAWQFQSGDETVAFILDPARELDSLALQLLDRGLHVVAHQRQVRDTARLVGMDAELRRRQGEDQPSMARVNGFESQRVAQERPIRLRVLRVDECVDTSDHEWPPCRTRRLGAVFSQAVTIASRTLSFFAGLR